MPAYVYLNGRIIPTVEAQVSIFDIGLLRGFGIYEALRTAQRKPFHLAEHLARYHRSADALGLKFPADDAAITAAIDELIEKNVPQGSEATIKFILTGGTARGGIEYDPETPTFYIFVEPLTPWDEALYTQGASVTVFEHLRQFPAFKTTNYIQAVMLQKPRVEAGAIEILYTWQGNVLECATSNFCIVKDGKIITATDNVLHGITRQVALQLARDAGFMVEERAVTVDELRAADEAFLTSSFKDVMPVVRAGQEQIGDGKVGPVTTKVMDLYRAALAAN